MKRLLFLLLTVLVTVVAWAQAVPTHVSGHLDGVGDTIIFEHNDNSMEQGITVDSTVTKNGSFEFTVNIEHPAMLLFTDVEHSKSDNLVFQGVCFIIVPGEDAVVTGTLIDFKVGGSKIYERVTEVQAPMVQLFKGYGPEKFDSLRQIYSDHCLDYIKAHPDDEAGVLLAGGITDDAFNEALTVLTPTVREGRLASIIENRKKQMEMSAAAEKAAAKVGEGTMAPDFTLTTIDGKPLQLSKLRGKYVVLDFWGTWCAPCMSGMPAMKACYEKHKGQFEMVSIDCYDDEQKWKDTVAKLGLAWTQVRDGNETELVTSLYAVSGFPTKIVIDPNGQIISRTTGEDPEFYKLLDEVLGK
ncbi:MAG: AhpC/TSA family protein [Prevotella sp.]|nr:AhpC/TSA family protein [Prevotella sp.]